MVEWFVQVFIYIHNKLIRTEYFNGIFQPDSMAAEILTRHGCWIDFDMSTCLGLFYAKKFGSCVYCKFLFTFLCNYFLRGFINLFIYLCTWSYPIRIISKQIYLIHCRDSKQVRPLWVTVDLGVMAIIGVLHTPPDLHNKSKFRVIPRKLFLVEFFNKGYNRHILGPADVNT